MRRSLATSLGILALLLSACAGGGPASPGGSGSDEASRKPQEQAFSPPYPATAPSGRPQSIQKVTLSDDASSLIVEFVGGPGYLESDQCSSDYEPWVGPNADPLNIEIVETIPPFRVPLPPNVGCVALGYLYKFQLGLEKPFGGTTVVNAGDATTFLIRSPRTAPVIGSLPSGWHLVLAQQEEAGPPAIWFQVYSKAPVSDPPYEGPGRIVLYEALGTSPEWSDTRTEKSRERGGHPTNVSVNGQATHLWVDPSTGELLVYWTLDGKSVALIGNGADLQPAQLVKIAESVSIPSS